MSPRAKKNAFRIIFTVLALATIFTVATAFSGPASDPSTAGFRSPCAHALSKNDDCTFDRATDSLEAISNKINNL